MHDFVFIMCVYILSEWEDLAKQQIPILTQSPSPTAPAGFKEGYFSLTTLCGTKVPRGAGDGTQGLMTAPTALP